MMVELKSGETYSGMLANCDGFMNLHLKDSVCTSRDGERFWKLNECYIRGNMVKYIRLQEEVIEAAKEDKRERKPLTWTRVYSHACTRVHSPPCAGKQDRPC
ncbi:UNVERIFIED_CONTAM: hypothetical protein H355_005468 [Colinus virginianus]|nr:hypothetical protein H355_005468 [Colinus virginianus]